MKVSQILVAALALFALSLSVTKIARADWEISGSALINTGTEYLNSFNTATHAEAYSALGGGINFGISDPTGIFNVRRERTYRIYYQWNGGGTPTTISHVPVNWEVYLSMSQSSSSGVINCVLNGSVNGNSYSLSYYGYSTFPAPSTNTGSYVALVTQTGSTAYADFSWEYDGSIFSMSGGGTGDAIIDVGYGLGTPY